MSAYGGRFQTLKDLKGVNRVPYGRRQKLQAESGFAAGGATLRCAKEASANEAAAKEAAANKAAETAALRSSNAGLRAEGVTLRGEASRAAVEKARAAVEGEKLRSENEGLRGEVARAAEEGGKLRSEAAAEKARARAATARAAEEGARAQEEIRVLRLEAAQAKEANAARAGFAKQASAKEAAIKKAAAKQPAAAVPSLQRIDPPANEAAAAALGGGAGAAAPSLQRIEPPAKEATTQQAAAAAPRVSEGGDAGAATASLPVLPPHTGKEGAPQQAEEVPPSLPDARHVSGSDERRGEEQVPPPGNPPHQPIANLEEKLRCFNELMLLSGDASNAARPAIEVGASSVLQASGGGALWEEQGGAQPQAAPSAALQKVLDFAQKRVYDELDAECSVFAAHNALYVELGYENVPCYFDPEDTKGSYFLEIGPSGGGGPASFETEASFVLLVRVQKHANDDSAALRGYMMDETRIQRGLLANVPTAAVVYFIDGQIESVEVAYPQPKGARDPVARPDWGSKVSWDEIKALLIKAYDALCPPGADHLPEKVLQNELHQELFRRNVPCVREMPLFAHGKAFTVEEGRVDLVIAGRFFLELKIYKNVALSKKQVDRYRRMFEKNGIHIKNSAAVYFMPRTFNTVKGTWRNRYDINEFKY